MAVSRRMTIILTATITALALGLIGALLLVFDDTPAPSIAPMASAGTGDGGGEYVDPWAEHEERCGPVMEQTWGPNEDELVELREQNEQLAAALDEAGVDYELVVEEDGWEHVAPTGDDYEAFERVADEFWTSEGDGSDEEHLAMMREDNAAMAAHLDEQGIAYEIVAEADGWEHIEPATDDGWQAMEEFWRDQERQDLRERAEERGLDVEVVLACFDEERKLSGMYDSFDPFPLPMDMRMASEQKRMVEDLIAAFDEAGIDYQRLDVPFLQWDRDDAAATDIVEQLAEEHGYGVEMGGPGMMMEEEVAVEDELVEEAG